ncbi:uncharacterized protein LOC105840324 [Monomorium pharaonis]|uniref:uncharacterized protein LOC105840324 n=1 Tax=Monomorium pharaonis TaxID=307658 RepID=UPI00063F6E96|nr:uncharacterized protein LOC105840324 [Monomorium pharaonis]
MDCQSTRIQRHTHTHTHTQFWPILFSIHNLNIEPMIIGLYCGESKPPTPNEFLTSFVNELLIFLNNGIIINGYKINIRVRCFICDTPARCFIKGTVNFNSYSSCLKCTTTGEYYYKEHRISFPHIDMPRRTDTTFRNRTDPDHYKMDTLLKKLPIDMIKSIPVSDSLHLLDLENKKVFEWETTHCHK